MVGLHPHLAFAVEEAIKLTKIDFTVAEGVRTTARQRELVSKGYSKTMNSYHLYGLAVDLVPWIHGAPTWEDIGAFGAIHEAMSEVIHTHGLKIDNGFDLWGWDRPHWQLTGMREHYDIRKIDPKRFPQ